MTAAVVNVTNSSSAAGQSLTVNMPSSPTVGNLLVLFLGWWDGITLAGLTGWTQQAFSGGLQERMAVFTRVVDGSEPSSYTLTGFSMVADPRTATIVQVSGHNGFNAGAALQDNTTLTVWPVVNAASTVADALILRACAGQNMTTTVTWTWSGTTTPLADFHSAVGSGWYGHQSVVSQVLAAAGTTAAATVTRSVSSDSHYFATATVAIAPAGGGGGEPGILRWNGTAWVQTGETHRWTGSVWTPAAMPAFPGAVVISSPYPPGSTSVSVMSVNDLIPVFDDVKGAADTYMNARTPADASDIYECGYYWEGFCGAFEATHNPGMLDIMLKHVKRFITGAQSVPGGYLGWLNANSAYAAVGDEFPLLESYGWRFVARMLYLMKTIGVTGTYLTDYNNILSFTEQNLWRKWYNRSINHLYRVNTHMASHWAGMGMHLAPLTSDATLRSQYLTVARNIMFAGIPTFSGASIKSQMHNNASNANAYHWDYDWGQSSYPGSDTNHGEATVTQAIMAFDLGLVLQELGSAGWTAGWTMTDMNKLRVMFSDIIWPVGQAYTSASVDGTGGNGGWGIRGYSKLGRFNVALQNRLTGDPSNAWDIGDTMANARILRGGTD